MPRQLFNTTHNFECNFFTINYFFLVKLAVPSRKQSSLLIVSLHKSYRLQYYYQASIQASNWPPSSWVVNYGEIFVSHFMLYMSLTISTCLVLYHCYWVIVKIIFKMELTTEGSKLIHDRFTLNETVGYKQYTCVTLHCSKHFHLSEYLRGVPWVQDGRYIQKENGLTVLN